MEATGVTAAASGKVEVVMAAVDLVRGSAMVGLGTGTQERGVVGTDQAR